jgi:transcriptional regulator with XRE-family HTH domain
MNGKQLQRLLDAAGLSQRGAARRLGIDERTMRRYIADELPVPRSVQIALERLRGGVVGVDELDDRELESFNSAIESARAVAPTDWIHCEPVRDATGRFSEVRVFGSDELRDLLAVIPIGQDGQPEKPKRVRKATR